MFQGGQNGIKNAVPKARGFKSANTSPSCLSRSPRGYDWCSRQFSLYEAGLVATPFHTIKVIARGELSSKLTLKVQGASKNVISAIEKAGGSLRGSDSTQKSAKRSKKEADK